LFTQFLKVIEKRHFALTGYIASGFKYLLDDGLRNAHEPPLNHFWIQRKTFTEYFYFVTDLF
jgi:hypothetical protein